MGIWEFLDIHPGWGMAYLLVLVLGFNMAVYGVAGIFQKKEDPKKGEGKRDE
jgi:hypothetical protein